MRLWLKGIEVSDIVLVVILVSVWVYSLAVGAYWVAMYVIAMYYGGLMQVFQDGRWKILICAHFTQTARSPYSLPTRYTQLTSWCSSADTPMGSAMASAGSFVP